LFAAIVSVSAPHGRRRTGEKVSTITPTRGGEEASETPEIDDGKERYGCSCHGPAL
jgi:hypothetical protein